MFFFSPSKKISEQNKPSVLLFLSSHFFNQIVIRPVAMLLVQ